MSRLADRSRDDQDPEGDGGNGTSTELHRIKLAAPVLSMDFCPASAPMLGGGGAARGLLLAGGMDGGSHLISIDGNGSGSGDGDDVEGCGDGGSAGEDGDREAGTGKNGVALLASMKNHAKYVVVCRYVTFQHQNTAGLHCSSTVCSACAGR